LSTPQGFGASPFDGQPVSPLNPVVLVKGCDASGNVCATSGIGIQNFASTSYVNSQFTGANGQISTLNGQISTLNGQTAILSAQTSTLNNQVTNLNNQVHRDVSFAAAVGAMRDAIPNSGDRFAVRLNAASVGDAVAAGFSMSANLGDKLRASVNYGGSRGENVVSGGLNFSFN